MGGQSKSDEKLQQVYEVCVSIGVLVVVLWWKEEFTPDFFHYATLLYEDEVHMIWCFILWSTYKCWFASGSSLGHPFKAYIFFSYVEVVLGFLIANELSFKNLILYSLLIGILVLRSNYPKFLNAFIILTIFLYFT